MHLYEHSFCFISKGPTSIFIIYLAYKPLPIKQNEGMYLFLFLKLSNIEMDTFRAICTYLKSSFDKSSLFLPCYFQNITMNNPYLGQSANCSVMKGTTDVKLDIL